MLNPKFIESQIDYNESLLYGVIGKSVSNIVTNTLRTKTIDKAKDTRFLFSAVLRPFLYTVWNVGFNLGNTHASAELRSADFTNCSIVAEFANEDDSLTQQEKLMNDLRKQRLQTIEDEIKSLGFNSTKEAEGFANRFAKNRNKTSSIMSQRGIDPNNMETVEDLLTEARGLSLDISDTDNYLSQIAQKQAKAKKALSNNPLQPDPIDNIDQTESVSKQPLSPAERLLRRANSRKGFIERAISANKQAADNPKKADAASIRDTKLRQEQISNEITRQQQIDLSSTDYANAYLDSRTQMLSQRLNDELNALYKKRISEYLAQVQNSGQRSLNPEQQLIDELSGKQSNKKVVQRINDLLAQNNVISKKKLAKGVDSNTDSFEVISNTESEIEAYTDQLNYLKEELGYDASDNLSTVKQDLVDYISAAEDRRQRGQLTYNEQVQLNKQLDYLKKINTQENNLTEAQQLLSQLNSSSVNSGRDLSKVIQLTAADKQLLGTNADNLTVAQLDEIRKQAIQQTRIPATNSILRTIRTELNTAYNMGRMNRFQTEKEISGNDVCVEWRNDIESNVCQYCASRAGTVISIDDVLTQGRIKHSSEYFIPAHPNCVLENAPITMRDGSVKQIKDVKVGDFVITGTDRMHSANFVYATMKSKYKGKIIRFTLEDGRTIESTEDHSFFDGMGWRRAKDFGKNESLYSYTINNAFENKGQKQDTSISTDCISAIRNRSYVYERNNRLYRNKKYKTDSSNIGIFKFRATTKGLDLGWSETSNSIGKNENKQSDVQSTNKTQNAIKYLKTKTGVLLSNSYRKRALSRWKKRGYKQPILSIFLGSKLCKNSKLFKSTLDIRASSIRTIERKILSTGLLSTKSELVHRSKRILAGRCETEISIISPRIFSYQNSGYRSDEIQIPNFLLSLFTQLRIVNIESYDYEGFVYNISVKDDECYLVNNVISKNCRCYWTPVSCTNKQKKPVYGTIAKWAAGTSLGVLGIVGAYLAINSLRSSRRKQNNLSDAIKQRVTKQQPLTKPLTEIVEEAIKDSRIAEPVKQEVIKQVKDDFVKAVKKELPQPVKETLTQLKKENTDLLRQTFESLNNINSLSSNARTTFNRIINDLNNASSPEELAQVRDRANAFSRQISDEIEAAKLNRSRASANLANTAGSISDIRRSVTDGIVNNDDFADKYNTYRRLESPIVDIVDSIDDVNTLNNQGVQINDYIDRYDTTLSGNINDLSQLNDELQNIILSTNAQLPEEQADNFIRRRLDEINTNMDSLRKSKLTTTLTKNSTFNKLQQYQQELRSYTQQLNSITYLRKIGAEGQPSYEYYRKRIQEILSYISEVKGRFPEDPNNMYNEIPILGSYLSDSQNAYLRKIVRTRNERLEPAIAIYNQLEDIENQLNSFIDAVEIKPKLKTIDRLQNIGVTLSREEYIAQIADEISSLKKLGSRRTAEQNARLNELTVEQVRVLRAEFRRPILQNIAEFNRIKKGTNRFLKSNKYFSYKFD